MPIDNTRQVRIVRAQQGGFSAHVLPAAVPYVPVDREWGIGYVWENPNVGEWTAYPGDGNTSASVLHAVDPDDGYVTNIHGYPVKNDEMLIVMRAAQIDGNSTIFQVGAATEGGTGMVHSGIRRQGFLINSTQATLVTLTQTFAEYAFNADFWFYKWGNADAGYVDGGQMNVPEDDYWFPSVLSAVAYGDNVPTLTPSNTATWGITAPKLGIYNETTAGGLFGMEDQTTNEPLAGTYDLAAVEDIVYPYYRASGVLTPYISLPFGKDWTADLAAAGLTL